jgi:hypothetical protein
MGSYIICAINSVAEILHDLQAGLFSNRYVYWKCNKNSKSEFSKVTCSVFLIQVLLVILTAYALLSKRKTS